MHTQGCLEAGGVAARLGAALLVADLACVTVVLWHPGVAREHGPLESLQALGLLLAALAFLGAGAPRRPRSLGALGWSLALFCLTFFLLEFDTRPFGVEPLTRLTNGPVRDAWLAGLWLAMAGVVLTRRRAVWATFRGWLATPSGGAMVAAGAFWFLSQALETGPLQDVLGPHFLEEMVEVNAVLLMLAAGVLARRCARRPPATR